MKQSEINEIAQFLYNEDNRLEALMHDRWRYILNRRKFDSLDLLDLIELSVQMDYFNYLQKRLHKLIEYMKDIY